MKIGRGAGSSLIDLETTAVRPRMKIAYFVLKYPTSSQTFIEREMLGLRAHGINVEVHPCFDFRSAAGLPAPPGGLTVVRVASRLRLLGSMCVGTAYELARRPSLLPLGLGLLRRHWPRHAEGWFMTLWGTFFALARARHFRRARTEHFHGAWATAPATVAAVLGTLCGRPFSFGAHAYDLHRHGGDPLLPAKLLAARFVHTTTEANVRSLRERFPEGRATILLARRGLNRLPGIRPASRVTEIAAREVRVLSVGRLVEKKGHLLQLAAASALKRRNCQFRLRIIGEGPLREMLTKAIQQRDLQSSVVLEGERTPGEIEEAYQWADIFWHTGIVDSQGDRDGLPNVVPEAMAHELPVISSAAGGAGEAIRHEETGLIVDPADAEALADAVLRLAKDGALRARLGRTAREWVGESFLAEANTRKLADAFRESVATSATN